MDDTPVYEKLRNRILELEQKAAEKLRLEKALLESEKKYRELVQNANSVIIRSIFYNQGKGTGHRSGVGLCLWNCK